MSDSINTQNPEPRGPGRGTVAFLTLLLTAGIGLGGLAAYRAATPQPTPPDIAKDAQDYLRARKAAPLSGLLAQLLADPDTFLISTQAHPLLGKPAPEFELSDPAGVRHKLSDLRSDGPVVLVFYFGYNCNHCVSQLFDMNEEMTRFKELGTEVVAISADPPELTRQRFARYGAFSFPVLSDADKEAARAYGVFTPAAGGREESLDHGTFVISRDGVIRWARQGDEPFNGSRTLLYEAARAEGRLPLAPSTAKASITVPTQR
jgi:peroxiredoxin